MRTPVTATEGVLQAYRLPGLSLRAAAFVVELALRHFPGWDKPTGRPRALSVVQAVRLALGRLRRTTYQDLHEGFGIGVTTAWVYHQVTVVFLADLLGAADEGGLSALVAGKVCPVDGTLIPTFNWGHRKDLASGKHRRYGVDVQLLVGLHGRLLGASPASPEAGTVCTASGTPAGSTCRGGQAEE